MALATSHKPKSMVSTCDGLRAWYKQLGQSYPTDDGGRGLFTEWFEEGGFEENNMQEEFDEELDCAYLDFAVDDNTESNAFPLPNASKQSGEQEKQRHQLRVMKHCWEYGTAPNSKLNSTPSASALLETYRAMLYDQIDFSELKALSNTEYPPELATKTSELYQQEFTKLGEMLMYQADLLSFLALGQKHGVPLLTYLACCYMRARVDLHVAEKAKGKGGPNNPIEQLPPIKWAKRNAFVQYLEKRYGEPIRELIVQAIESYAKRVVPRYIYLDKIGCVINDDIFEIVRYLKAATEFVQWMIDDGAAQDASACPLQFDFAIAIRECVDRHVKRKVLLPFEDENDESSEDEEDDYKNGDPQGLSIYFDTIRDIENRLTKSGTRFVKQEVDTEKYVQSATSPQLRHLKQVFHELHEKYKPKSFPHGHRMCCVVDRRKKFSKLRPNPKPTEDDFMEIPRLEQADGSQKKDDIYFYLPPDNCDRVDNPHRLKEVYFDRMRQCLIPNPEYKEDDGLSFLRNLTPRSELLRRAVTSASACNGGLVTFSFHVDAQDEISCYFYWNGQCTRFLPQDVAVILPDIFSETEKNKKFAELAKQNDNSEEAKEVKYLLDGIKFEDPRFESFCKLVNSKESKETN